MSIRTSLLESCFVACSAALFVAGAASAQVPDATGELLDAALAGPQRLEKNRVRDVHRHPKETLLFFGLRPDMTVVEIWPAGGWYTEILAPLLKGKGRYIAAHVAHEDPALPGWQKRSRDDFVERFVRRPDVFGTVTVTSFRPPDFGDIAPRGAVDLVLTFRNVHNWSAAGSDAAAFRIFHDALRPGGMLGVVEHRAREGTSFEQMTKTGYMTEAHVIRLAEAAGFRLDARSEINANPRDTKDHPDGVWSLPPMLRGSVFSRDRFLAIGESDRMTLRFAKPR